MGSVVEEREDLLGRSGVRIIREPRLVERVVFVGGLPGCGKTLMTHLLGGLARVETQTYNYPLEHLCGLYLLGQIDEGPAIAMVRMWTDLDLYNLTMSRGVNFRFSDYTCALRNPGGWRYVRRLFQPGDAAAVERIRHTHPILHLTIHNLLAISPLLFKALDDRLRLLEVVRHPLYMIKQWYLYIHRYGTDVRDFTVWFDYEGQALPFFARGWEEQYVRANLMDRVIYSIERLSQLGQRVLDGLSERERAQVMILPFEPFVLDPWPYLRQLEGLLGTQVIARTRHELRRQRVPRRRIADGIPRKDYQQYGWEPAKPGLSEHDELDRRRQFAAREATPEALAVLDRLSESYEATYLDGHVRW